MLMELLAKVALPQGWEQTGHRVPFQSLLPFSTLARGETCSKDQESRVVPAGVLVTGMCEAASSHQTEGLLAQTDNIERLQVQPHLQVISPRESWKLRVLVEPVWEETLSFKREVTGLCDLWTGSLSSRYI